MHVVQCARHRQFRIGRRAVGVRRVHRVRGRGRRAGRSARRRSGGCSSPTRSRIAPTPRCKPSPTAHSPGSSRRSRVSDRRSARAVGFVAECRATLRAMLLLHEVHQLVGGQDDEFELHVRDGWMATLAKSDDGRLGWHLKLASVPTPRVPPRTVTLLADGNALRAPRSARAGRRPAVVGRARRHVATRGARQAAASRYVVTATPELDQVPTDGIERAAQLFMEDSAWPHEAMLDDYLRRRARTTHRASRSAPNARCSSWPPCSRPRARHAGARWCCGSACLTPAVDRALHSRAAARSQGAGHVDERRTAGARRLGEPPPAHQPLVTLAITPGVTCWCCSRRRCCRWCRR